MKVYGQLEKAQIENLAAAPTPASRGLVYFDTVLGVERIYDGAVWRTVVATDLAQTLSNKRLSDSLVFDQIATPASAPASTNRIYAKSDGYFYTMDSTGAERRIGSGAGGVEYLSNTDFESGTTGFATYADAAGTSPVDGTGGAPSHLTISASAVSPLSGTKSLLITNSGATSAQGEGVSAAFTIDRAGQGKVLKVSFDYEAASGTFQAGDSSDLKVFVYDVTNSVLIPVTPNSIQANPRDTFVGLFQTPTNSLSFRLILHVATTAAVAWTFKVDSVSVTPQNVAYGSPTSDWTAFPMVITGTTSNPVKGTAVTDKAKWRRVGDSMEIRYDYYQSAADGTNGVGIYLYALPTGYLIDTAKIQVSTDGTTGTCGNVHIATAASYTGEVIAYDSTKVMLLIGNSVTANDFHGNVVHGFTTGFSNTFSCRVPILGWASSVQMSNDADTRVVAARYTLNSVQNIPNNADTIVNYSIKTYDTHGAVTTGASWKYTAPVSGYYKVKASISWVTVSGAASYRLKIFKNGVMHTQFAAEGDTYIFPVSDTVQLNAGDYIDIRTFQLSGAALDTDSAPESQFVTVERVSGPAAIAASETVVAVYQRTTAQSIPNSTDELVDLDVKLVDTHGAVTTGAAWKFTAPVSGLYNVSCSIGFAPNATGIRYLLVKKNGAFTAFGADSAPAFAGADLFLNTSVIFKLVAGDYLQISIFQSSGAALNTSSALALPIVSIHKIGM